MFWNLFLFRSTDPPDSVVIVARSEDEAAGFLLEKLAENDRPSGEYFLCEVNWSQNQNYKEPAISALWTAF